MTQRDKRLCVSEGVCVVCVGLCIGVCIVISEGKGHLCQRRCICVVYVACELL